MLTHVRMSCRVCNKLSNKGNKILLTDCALGWECLIDEICRHVFQGTGRRVGPDRVSESIDRQHDGPRELLIGKNDRVVEARGRVAGDPEHKDRSS